MALTFNSNSCLSGLANFALPAGDWCFALVYRITDNSGNFWNNLFSAGTSVGTGELDLSIGESGRASVMNAAQIRIGDGTALRVLTAPSDTAIIGPWALIVAQSNGGEEEIWQCALGGDPNKVASNPTSLGATSHNTPLFIGRRSMNQTGDHTLNGSIAYLARGSFALTAAEITAMAAGLCPRHVITSWTEYLPMFQSGPSSLKAVIGGGTYTVTGSPTTTGQPVQLW